MINFYAPNAKPRFVELSEEDEEGEEEMCGELLVSMYGKKMQ